MRTILHISDVHFGPPHLPRVSEGVLELIDRLRPGFVVVSGDLTQRAKPEQFQQARAFVDCIPVPSLVVPGNHDVPLYRVWERVFAPFGAYKKYFSPELEPVYRDGEMLVVGINTAFGWTIKDGRITLRRLLEVEQVLRSVPDGTFKVVVAHHHLIPPPNFGTQRVLANAYEAIDLFSSSGVDLILSGHLHQAYIGNSEEFYPKGRPPVVILHSGTTTSNRGRGGERESNTCNWIQADEKSMVVSHFRWHRKLDRFAEHSRHWYPRQELVPYTLEGLSSQTWEPERAASPAAPAEDPVPAHPPAL
ncbi:MAG TPA: metallophosphoesterase family protein [Thermoanaerobaculia bacterium]|nr:metallophosphoesterase family protein [Thermoanaerobaculia bacterium]